MEGKARSIEEEIEIFSRSLHDEIPRIIVRFQSVRKQEREAKADDLYLWQNVLGYYKEARNCFCCGFHLAAIQMITSSIEVGFKQIFLDSFPELYHEMMSDHRLRNLRHYTEEAHSREVISSELKKRIDQYRSSIRNMMTHPKPHMPLMLGLRELAPGSWGSTNPESLRTPEEAAHEGLICLLQLCKEFDDWKRNH